MGVASVALSGSRKFMRYPAAIATMSLTSMRGRMACAARELVGLFASSMTSASSEVARNTAMIVPVLMSPFSYSFAAITEKPHCGTMPVAAPRRGASGPCNVLRLLVMFVPRSKSSIRI